METTEDHHQSRPYGHQRGNKRDNIYDEICEIINSIIRLNLGWRREETIHIEHVGCI